MIPQLVPAHCSPISVCTTLFLGHCLFCSLGFVLDSIASSKVFVIDIHFGYLVLFFVNKTISSCLKLYSYV